MQRLIFTVRLVAAGNKADVIVIYFGRLSQIDWTAFRHLGFNQSQNALTTENKLFDIPLLKAWNTF